MAKTAKTRVTAPVLERWFNPKHESVMLAIADESVRPEVMSTGDTAILNVTCAAINDQLNEEYPVWLVKKVSEVQLVRLGSKKKH